MALTRLGTNAIITVPSSAITALPAGVGGLTELDQWRLTTDFSSDAIITSNLERNDSSWFTKVGTGMTESSGVFTFPSTGYWLVSAQATIFSNQYGNTCLQILVTTNNSTYTNACEIKEGNANYGVGNEPNATCYGSELIYVSNTSNVKVKFRTAAFGGGSTLRGSTTINSTAFTFMKISN